MPFRTNMEQIAKTKASNIVLALDLPFEKPEHQHTLYLRANRILETVHSYICAIKINHHLTIPLNVFGEVQRLLKKAHDFGIMTIMDCKANDIGSTNEVMAKYYYAAGFDALIVNPFIGWEEGAKPIFEVARKMDRGVLLLVFMSHKGAREGYGQRIYDVETGEKMFQYLVFAKKAIAWKADGAIVGALYPEKIREVSQMLGEAVPVYSPGIGAQGGNIQITMMAGARYIIVGRAITLAENPEESVKTIRTAINSVR